MQLWVSAFEVIWRDTFEVGSTPSRGTPLKAVTHFYTCMSTLHCGTALVCIRFVELGRLAPGLAGQLGGGSEWFSVDSYEHVCQGRCYYCSLLAFSGQPHSPTTLAPARWLTVLVRHMVELGELVKLKEWDNLQEVLSEEQKVNYRQMLVAHTSGGHTPLHEPRMTGSWSGAGLENPVVYVVTVSLKAMHEGQANESLPPLTVTSDPQLSVHEAQEQACKVALGFLLSVGADQTRLVPSTLRRGLQSVALLREAGRKVSRAAGSPPPGTWREWMPQLALSGPTQDTHRAWVDLTQAKAADVMNAFLCPQRKCGRLNPSRFPSCLRQTMAKNLPKNGLKTFLLQHSDIFEVHEEGREGEWTFSIKMSSHQPLPPTYMGSVAPTTGQRDEHGNEWGLLPGSSDGESILPWSSHGMKIMTGSSNRSLDQATDKSQLERERFEVALEIARKRIGTQLQGVCKLLEVAEMLDPAAGSCLGTLLPPPSPPWPPGLIDGGWGLPLLPPQPWHDKTGWDGREHRGDRGHGTQKQSGSGRRHCRVEQDAHAARRRWHRLKDPAGTSSLSPVLTVEDCITRGLLRPDALQPSCEGFSH